jgi:hypothetical protein
LAARLLRLSSGRRRVTPIAGDCQLTVSRPAGRAVLAAVIRAGARRLVAARSLTAGDGQSLHRRPVGRAAPALLDQSEARGLAGQWMSLLHAGPSAASPRLRCARARGWAEPDPVGCPTSPPLCPAARLPLYSTGRRRVASPVSGRHCCTLARRLLLLASTVPGPAAGPNPAQSAAPPRLHCARACGRAGPGSCLTPHRPAGGPRPDSATAVAVTPADGRPQTGRRGVLTRIPVGAAAVAGPGRLHSSAGLAGPVPTTRHGDEAAASCSCRFPVPFGVFAGFDCYVV